MAPRRKLRRAEGLLSFEAIVFEGGLLSPEWLTKLAQLEADGQSEADYRVPKGLALRDEIGRYWRIARAHWAEFVKGREANADPQALARRFVTALFRESLGFESLAEVAPVERNGHIFPIGHAALGGRVPVVIAPAGSGLDTPDAVFGEPGRRRTPFGLAQEYLNAEDWALWGIASDGLSLRILRDNASLTRPAWVSADLETIFTGEGSFADFTALWLLAHETRFGRAGEAPTSCALEAWREAGREEGTRAREHLRDGVEEALRELGTGFLAHPANKLLHAALEDGSLTTRAYFEQLHRLVYRLLFLLTVEERGLLHPESALAEARALYGAGYSLKRLRERAARRSAHDRFPDLWEGLKIVFRGLAAGEPRLGLPALAGLFATDRCTALDAARLENRSLLRALFRLTWLREETGLSRVNWRDMGPEEMGSVYESLLELVPRVVGGRTFDFATGAETKGNARKTSGSYYTPDSLVQVLLQSAFEPVVREKIAAHPADSAAALLGLSIVDPACGSGHFLLAAGRRLAAHIARLRAEGTPTAAEYRHALREVVGRCLYGVDLNPMAVELCKVSLWMEAVEPGKPLSFLDSHIRLGNSLLGATPELMEKGIPDAAWDPIGEDDKVVARALKRRNKEAASGQRGLPLGFSAEADSEAKAVSRAVVALDQLPDGDIEAVHRKEAEWNGLLSSEEYRHQKFVADAWTAAFVWPKKAGALADAAPTNDLWRQLRDRLAEPSDLTRKTVEEIAERYRLFHWHLAFPNVIAKGGFDVVLGNPPWERVKLQEQEFFAERSPEIAAAPNASARTALIRALVEGDPQLYVAFAQARRETEGSSQLLRMSGRFPLCGRGDVNTFAVFAEMNRSLIASSGRAGFIVPTGIATDDTTKHFFQEVVQSQALVSLYDFQSSPGLFGEIGHARFKFCLLTLGRPTAGTGGDAEFAFFLRSTEELSDPERRFRLSPEDVRLLNPNTGTCPIFRTRRDAEITKGIYRRVPVLIDESKGEEGNPWGISFLRLLDMSNDSGLFRTRKQLETDSWALEGNVFHKDGERYLPLYEAKMAHHFNHRFGDYAMKPDGSESTALPEVPLEKLQDPSYAPLPKYWVPNTEVEARLAARWGRQWLLGWRDITNATNERAVIASVIPAVGVGNQFPIMLVQDPRWSGHLAANLSGFALDFAARQKVGGTHLNFFVFKQIPVLAPRTYLGPAPWLTEQSIGDWIRSRILELIFTSHDIRAFASDLGYDGVPYRWDPTRRFLLRAELDAALFHIYGIPREDAAYILDTFPIVRENDKKAHGEYRTKRVILEIYDEMAEAIRTGKPYQTRLDPPPADPRVAHPANSRPEWAKPPLTPART